MSEEKKVGVLEEREQNEVDLLKARISEIQSACAHEFVLARKPRLVKSLVPGVYVGKVAAREGLPPINRSDIRMILRCRKCSAVEEASILNACPLCLNSMVRDRCLGAGSREKYFGESYSYYEISLSHCSNCDFVIAFDQFDQ